MKFRLLLPFALVCALSPGVCRAAQEPAAGEATVKVHYAEALLPVPKHTVALNMEDINFQIYGGFYSQMIVGESFQEPATDNGVSRQWGRLDRGSARGQLQVVTPGLYGEKQSQQIEFVQGAGEVGIVNSGPNTHPLLERWGLSVQKGKPYEGVIRIKALSKATVYVSFRNADGSVIYDEQALPLEADANRFQRLAFTLTPKAADPKAQFAITLKAQSKIVIGYVFVQPGEWGRYKGLPIRKDLAEAVLNQGPTLIRYNGSMVEPERGGAPFIAKLPLQYRWKDMIGPRDERPPYFGYWNLYSTHGFGIFEFLDFCEKAGIEPVVGINLKETDQDLEDFAEYVNGPATSPWGAIRAANGHPEPYHLKRIQLGNENETALPKHSEACKRVMQALWRKDKSILPVMADWIFFDEITDPANFVRMPSKKGVWDRKIDPILDLLRFFKENGVEGKNLWWDVHVQVYQPRSVEQLDGGLRGICSLKKWISALAPECGNVQIAVLEENSTTHAMKRAIGHARMKNELLRHGDWIPAAGLANAIQAYNQFGYYNGFRQYDQGHITFTADRVFFQPVYYVDQMIAKNWSGRLVASETASPNQALDVTAIRDESGKSLVLSVVNLEPTPLRTAIAVSGFPGAQAGIEREEIAGDLEAVNTLEEPEKVKPTRSTGTVRLKEGVFETVFPGNSFTLIRLTASGK